MPFENLKLGPRERSTSRIKRKLMDHKREEIEESDRDVRRRCADCYIKIKQQQSKGTNDATANKVKAFCSDCDKLHCFSCCNEKHRGVNL